MSDIPLVFNMATVQLLRETGNSDVDDFLKYAADGLHGAAVAYIIELAFAGFPDAAVLEATNLIAQGCKCAGFPLARDVYNPIRKPGQAYPPHMKPDPVEYVRYLELGASCNDMLAADSAFYLAEFYYEEQSDYLSAKRWYERAALLGHAEAAVFIGWMYEDGAGVPVDYIEAARWFMKVMELPACDSFISSREDDWPATKDTGWRDDERLQDYLDSLPHDKHAVLLSIVKRKTAPYSERTNKADIAALRQIYSIVNDRRISDGDFRSRVNSLFRSRQQQGGVN